MDYSKIQPPLYAAWLMLVGAALSCAAILAIFTSHHRVALALSGVSTACFAWASDAFAVYSVRLLKQIEEMDKSVQAKEAPR